jgi:FAD:protein FMN transferase
MTTSKKFALFGGQIGITLYDVEGSPADLLMDKLYCEALRLNKIFNFYDAKSELSRLNQKRKMKVSKELIEAVKMALPYCELTKGAYDISLGKQIMLRKAGKPSGVVCSYNDILADGNEITLRGTEAMIDLGSVAKGYIGDRLLEIIKDFGVESSLIDMRGDMLLHGETEEPVQVKHPRKEGPICSFKANNAAIATSGDYNQFYGSHENSHIINAKGIISATVLADTLAEADILATCLMVADRKLFEGRKYLLIDKDLRLVDTIGCQYET